MKKRLTKERTFNGKEIQMQEGNGADCNVLNAIEEFIDTAVNSGAGKMLLYEFTLPSQYSVDGANRVFMKTQANLCKYQKRADKSSTTPRYIAVRDAFSDVPRYKVAMFLPKETTYEKERFQDKANEITNGQLKDWKAFREHDLLAFCERKGLEVKDMIPLDGTKEASDEAFYVASELAAVKLEPRAERTLFRSRKQNN